MKRSDSEHELQTKLRLTGHIGDAATSDLRNDRSSAGVIAVSGGCGGAPVRSCGTAARSCVDDRWARTEYAGDREVGMVEDIKNLGPELEG